ncbi:hypothetical protein GGR52DRAFT_222045 [Hypoxylon sp. FL1284]|nr:hypothetical protein GGR52DRAFT_222045 [Hypoxylon sp. FL1284]
MCWCVVIVVLCLLACFRKQEAIAVTLGWQCQLAMRKASRYVITQVTVSLPISVPYSRYHPLLTPGFFFFCFPPPPLPLFFLTRVVIHSSPTDYPKNSRTPSPQISFR